VYRDQLNGQGLVGVGDAIVDIRKHIEKHGFRPESKKWKQKPPIPERLPCGLSQPRQLNV